MNEFDESDLDRSTAAAWRRFQARLADRIVGMADEEVVVVSAGSMVDDEADVEAPYVRFRGCGDALVRCEVFGNAGLPEAAKLDEAAVESVLRLGWSVASVSRGEEPGEGSADLYVDVERSEGDRLAVMTVRMLREVFGVPHPAFLSAADVAGDPSSNSGAPAAVEGPFEEAPEVPAVFPRDPQHLQSLVDETLAGFVGGPPEHDEDGDVPVICGRVCIFVHVVRRQPAVHLFCSLVHDVRDVERAAYEVTLLNRRHRFLKFVLYDDSVLAYVDIPAYPFAPAHLRYMLRVMSEAAQGLDDELTDRIGGCRTLEADPDGLREETEAADVHGATDALHPAMQTLRELEAGTPGSTTPELAASICAMDRELVLELIGWNAEQERAWGQAREKARLAGDSAEAEICDHEASRAATMVDLLRRTLRLVVEEQLGRDLGALSYRLGRRQPVTPRERDVALPGLDPAGEQLGLFDDG